MQMTGCLWPCAAAVVAAAAATTGSGVGRRGGGLFRSKAKGPTEVVRHVRELLSFVTENQEDCHGKRDAKRDQKVIYIFVTFFPFPLLFVLFDLEQILVGFEFYSWKATVLRCLIGVIPMCLWGFVMLCSGFITLFFSYIFVSTRK